VCGQGGIDFYRRYGGERKPRFFVPYDVDDSGIRAITEEQVNEARQRFDLANGRRRFVFCGRFVQVKRVDLLVDAFIAIADKRPDWDLLLIGDGPLKDRIRERVPAWLAHRIVWTGFVGDRTIIFSLYHAGHVFVLPSEYEPWGAVIAEACAAGLAIVSSDVAGAALELVRDGTNGRLFRSGDVESLTAMLLHTSDDDTARRMGAASHSVLAEWRVRSDPVVGVRNMLTHVGVLNGDQTALEGSTIIRGDHNS
jgi:glycosyltransferase involved in cell wall biosynthesis